MRLILQGIVAPDIYGTMFSGMDKSGVLHLGLQTLWEAERGSKYVDRQWATSESDNSLSCIVPQNETKGSTATAEE